MHEVVCDFPLPCTPHIKAEKGIFVFKKSRLSAGVVVHVSFQFVGIPKSPYCGGSPVSSICAEKRTAFSMALVEGSSPLEASISLRPSSASCWSKIGIWDVGLLGSISWTLYTWFSVSGPVSAPEAS
jgi:hypothetical protein